MSRDTIAAIATPVGVGGVGIIRISGPDSIEILADLIGRPASRLVDRTLIYGVARDREGARLDDALVVAMRGPRSFTGEDVGEIHGHGGSWNMRRLLRAVIARGARHAEAGEFTRRAFEAGKIDLLGAEAMLGVIEAGSERAWRLSQSQLAGSLGEEVSGLRGRGIAMLAEVEATIDFPEDDVDYLRARGIAERAGELATELLELARTYAVGAAIRDGIQVAIVGAVNAGKSSIFNALIGEERAIVTPEPGTTRDYVEARTVWQGIPVMLIDTAGAREDASSSAEAMGQERGRARAEQADVRIRILPADEILPETEAAGEMNVVSKADLATVESAWLRTSARTGQGVEELRARILEQVLGTSVEADTGMTVTTERQYDALRRAASVFQRGAAAVAGGVAPELVAMDLREGIDVLAEMTGEDVSEDVLDSLFAQFCIGK